MPNIHVDHSRDSRLRLVFDKAVESCSLAADATFGDVARTLGELSNRSRGNLIAVDVTLSLPLPTFARLPKRTSRRRVHPTSGATSE